MDDEDFQAVKVWIHFYSFYFHFAVSLHVVFICAGQSSA